MNIEQLRHNLRQKWLAYYREHRSWLIKLGVWVNHEGQRRPSSTFILATATLLEPQLTDLLPLVVDLSQDPDHIVEALGLDFDPDVALQTAIAPSTVTPPPQILPSRTVTLAPPTGVEKSLKMATTMTVEPIPVDPAPPAPPPTTATSPAMPPPTYPWLRSDDSCQGKRQRPQPDIDRQMGRS